MNHQAPTSAEFEKWLSDNAQYSRCHVSAWAAWQASRAAMQTAEPAYPHPKCDAGCYYCCTKGGQQAPDCVAPDRAPSIGPAATGEMPSWSKTVGGAFVSGPYSVVERVDGKGWNASALYEDFRGWISIQQAVPKLEAIAACEKHARTPQPAPSIDSAADAKDAARYRWLCERYGVTTLPCFLEAHFEKGYIADGKYSIDTAIDAAMSAIAALQPEGK